jgi:hypothetical protein
MKESDIYGINSCAWLIEQYAMKTREEVDV